jgi:hypothetical protein
MIYLLRMVIFHGSVSLPKVKLVYNWLNGRIYGGHMIYIYTYIYTYGFGPLSFLLDKHEDLSHKYMENHGNRSKKLGMVIPFHANPENMAI